MLQWTCEYSAGVERATSNETNLSLAGSCYAVRLTQRLLKKYYLFDKKLLYLVDTFFGTWAFTVPIDKRRSLFELFALLRLFEWFDFFPGPPCKGHLGERLGYGDALSDGWVKYRIAEHPPGSKRLT